MHVRAPSVTSPDDDAIQSVKPIKAKTRCRGIRLDEPLIGRVERAAIQRELTGRESEMEAAEERIAASLDRLGREIRSVKLGQQALFAFLDSLVKTFLTCIAELPSDAHDQAVARGIPIEWRDVQNPPAFSWRARHLQFSKTARKHSSDPLTSRRRLRFLASVRPLFMLMLSGSRFPISE